MRPLQLLILFLLVTLPIATVLAQDAAGAELSAEAVNAADLATVPARVRPPLVPDETTESGDAFLFQRRPSP